MKYDISEIGQINCQLTDDGEYEVSYYDSEYFHQMGDWDVLTLDEIEEEFGEALAKDVYAECQDGKEHSFEILAYQNDNVDLSNPNEVNAAAIRVLRHGEYYKDCRGFILTNGVVVYTDQEHNQCTRIPGVKSTFDFIKMGNIRVLDHSIDIAKAPTPAQWSVLSQVLDSYYGEVLYLDLENDGRQYYFCNPEEVERDIYNYFNFYKISESTYTVSGSALRKIISESITRILLEMK